MPTRRVVISNSKLNRYGFRMLTEGADIKQYERNPILLFMHNRPWRGTKDEVLAIGTIKNISIEGDDIIGELDFDMKDDYSAKIAQKWDDGIYKMVSVGATPIEYSEDPSVLLQGQTRATITKWRLDEVSVVDVGANDDAIALKDIEGKYITLKDAANLDFIPIIQTKKSMKQIALRYGLPEDATEEQILAAIDAERAQNKSLKDESERQTLAAITSAVKLAVDQKRITEAQTNHFVELGKKVGIESLNVTLSAIEPALKPSDIITGKGTQTQKVELTDKKWADLNADERVQLRSENPEVYIKMYEAEYGFKPKL